MSISIDRRTPAAGLSTLLPFVVLLAVLAATFAGTGIEMVRIWIRSETYTHAFLVPPISLWLAWRSRSRLAMLPRRPEPWMLLPIAAVCLLWLVGKAALVSTASHFALVSLIVLSVPALFGWQVARALTFPLLFLYFSVPFGEFMVPQLMDWTADFAVLALRAGGIPVYREGLHFVIPSGSWSVVEACSGVRYLIASFMVGALFAYLNYRSTRRRLLFMLVALLVPLVANWVRAYMIVMIGHLSGNELAVGVDHLIYGWVFFGVVIGLMFFIGARWAEPDADDAGSAGQPAAPNSTALGAGSGWRMVAAIVALAVATVAAHASSMRPARSNPPEMVLPPPPAGWLPTDAALPWPPGFRNPSAQAVQSVRRGDRVVWIWAGHYEQQNEDRKLVSSVNAIVPVEGESWTPADRRIRADSNGLPALQVSTIRRGHGLGVGASQRIQVWRLYRVGGRWLGSDAGAKVLQAAGSLFGRGDAGAVVLIGTEDGPDAAATLEEYARAGLGSVAASLDGMATLRD